MASIFMGLLFFSVGVAFLYWRIKYPIEKPGVGADNFRIVIMGIAGIAFGVYILYLCIKDPAHPPFP